MNQIGTGNLHLWTVLEHYSLLTANATDLSKEVRSKAVVLVFTLHFQSLLSHVLCTAEMAAQESEFDLQQAQINKNNIASTLHVGRIVFLEHHVSTFL